MRRIGIIGHGSIGRIVAEAVASGRVPGGQLSGIALRAGRVGDEVTAGRALSAEALIAASDVIVEAAGAQAVREVVPLALAADRDVVVVSTGPLLDPHLFASLTAASRAARLHVAAGAVGGLDMVRAAAAMGPIHEARITTTKKPPGLVQDHMSIEERTRLASLETPTTLYEGGAPGLVAAYPASTNVAASLALAVGSIEVVTGCVVADPSATRTTHVIEVRGAAGDYRFEMTNHPSPTNPRSSAVVPWSVVTRLRDLCGSRWSR